MAKLFERVLENRIRRKTEERLEEEQMEFRYGRYTIDAIFVLRQVSKKKWDYNKKLVMAFLDIVKA